MKVLLCGFGRMGESHGLFYSVHPLVQVVGVVDPNPHRLARAAMLFPNAQLASSIEMATVEADTADICSPPIYHASQVRHFLLRGVNVLCEKPAILNPETGVKLSRLARSMRRTLHPIHNYLYSPAFGIMRDFVARGDLGHVVSVTVDVFRTGSARGVSDWRPNWREDPELSGGGVLVDHGSHWIYVLLHLLGTPSRIRCTLDSCDPVDREAHLSLEFEPLAHAHINLSWVSNVRANSLTVNMEGGWIRLVDGVVNIQTSSGSREFAISNDDSHAHMAWFSPLFRDYELLCKGDPGPTIEWENAVTVARVLQLSIESHDYGGVWLAYAQ
ncbi:Gfo/Idh/MocA family protein [Streptomyces griseorubiginosus]|uniref:Gfo/Idh/MocA family protein n=1 Tax=Streptomyces griseorubiginosus TaxID=67304 RepID=UPI003455A7C8